MQSLSLTASLPCLPQLAHISSPSSATGTQLMIKDACDFRMVVGGRGLGLGQHLTCPAFDRRLLVAFELKPIGDFVEADTYPRPPLALPVFPSLPLAFPLLGGTGAERAALPPHPRRDVVAWWQPAATDGEMSSPPAAPSAGRLGRFDLFPVPRSADRPGDRSRGKRTTVVS
ncbi:hypothetical protein THAOC_17428, partial [Thalassiosira oceanica]